MRQGGTPFQERRLAVDRQVHLLAAVATSRRATEAAVVLVRRWREGRPGQALAARDWLPVTLGHGTPQERLLIGALRDEFLAEVDGRLQSIYRGFYRSHSSATGVTQAARLHALSATQAEVLAVVAEYDWPWLGRWLWPEAPEAGAAHSLTRLSNFAFPIKRVNFRFTHHCNIACRHCYNHSGPEARSHRLTSEAMISIVAQMPLAGIDAVNLTGGEPMLYPKDVAAVIRAARAAGLREVSIFTNGFWATTAERADRELAGLIEAGFMRAPDDHLKVSAGAYHQEFLPFERILILAESYIRAFGKKLTIDFEVAAGQPDGPRAARAALHARGLLDRVQLLERTVQPLGRGRDLAVDADGSTSEPCRSINQIVFDPDGRVRPCCGMNSDNDGVVIGAMGGAGLRQLVKRMQNDGLLHALATRPMDHLLELSTSPGSQRVFSGPCHLCQHAIGALQDKEEVWDRCFDRQGYYPFWFDAPDGGKTIHARFDVGTLLPICHR